MKDNAVKSEIDKNNELCRSAVRVVVTLANLAEHGMLNEILNLPIIMLCQMSICVRCLIASLNKPTK